MEVGPEVACFVNNCYETPLHLAIKHGIEGKVSKPNLHLVAFFFLDLSLFYPL